jgi:hypothetical protein
MSLVGPRPERPEFVSRFIEELPEYSHRLSVKPGITGLAQVRANYTTTVENKLKFDLIYIKDYSPLLDFKLLLKTILVIFQPEHSKGFSINEIEVIEAEDLITLDKKGGLHKNHKIKKNLLLISCCVIAIACSLTLRYTILTVDVMNAFLQPCSTESLQVGAQVSGDGEFKALISGMTFTDKMEITYELFTKMKVEDLRLLEEFAQGGITVDERMAVQEMMPQYFQNDVLNLWKDVIISEKTKSK